MPELDDSTLPLQVECSPSAAAKCFSLRLGNGFVSVSAVMSFVGSVAAAQVSDFANFPNKIAIITGTFESVEKAKS